MVMRLKMCILVNVWIFVVRYVLLHHIFFAQLHVAAFDIAASYAMFIEIMNLCVVEILELNRTIVTFEVEP